MREWPPNLLTLDDFVEGCHGPANFGNVERLLPPQAYTVDAVRTCSILVTSMKSQGHTTHAIDARRENTHLRRESGREKRQRIQGKGVMGSGDGVTEAVLVLEAHDCNAPEMALRTHQTGSQLPSGTNMASLQHELDGQLTSTANTASR
jgi:hypothetical protein